MLTFTAVLFVVAVVMFLAGVFTWPSRHDFLSGGAAFGGVVIATVLVPLLVNSYELMHEPGWTGWYGKILNYVDTWGFIFWYIAGLVCLLEAGAALSRRFNVSPVGIPMPVAAGGTPGPVQWQAGILLFIMGVVAIAIGCQGHRKHYQMSQRPLVNKEFIEFQKKIEGDEVDGIEVQLFPAKSDIQIIFTGPTIENEDEQERWKGLTQDEFKKNENEELVVDKVTSVVAKSYDGKSISEFIVFFKGQVKKTAPKKPEIINDDGYIVPSGMDEAETKNWIEGWSSQILKISTPTAAPISTTSTTATTPTTNPAPAPSTGPVVLPPKPGRFIKKR